MARDKSHILLENIATSSPFSSKSSRRNPQTIHKDRLTHGQNLADQYQVAIETLEAKHGEREAALDDDLGIYVEIIGENGEELPITSLDLSKDYKLQSLRKEGGIETAIIYIPESQRNRFKSKIDAYLDPARDKKSGPANHALLNRINSIKVADLRSFWTDPPALFPEQRDLSVWWELWLKGDEETNLEEFAQQLADTIGAEISGETQSFHQTIVFLIRATTEQLEHSLDLISRLQEVRKAKKTPVPVVSGSMKQQLDLSDQVLSRIASVAEDTSVCVLDTGVNYNNPLLSPMCSEFDSIAWSDSWPKFDNYSVIQHSTPFNPHGSLQAGLIAFGDLTEAVHDSTPIQIPFRVESGRILPPDGNSPPHLWGAITTNTATQIKELHSQRNRVFSLAISSEETSEGGEPSSWSAAIDEFIYGQGVDGQVLVVATGNNFNLLPSPSVHAQAMRAEIEDPAQSWNSITVGAYTEKTSISDADFEGWRGLVKAGDISPSARTSVRWSWRNQAPFKPDIVAEGGNRLISEDSSEITDADDVSLLTVSGRSSGQLFETTRDSSAASALVARMCGILRHEYPGLWAESIRALVIHSADWTDQMYAIFGLLRKRQSEPDVNKFMLRFFGFGVPDLSVAQYSAENSLVLIAQDWIQPFVKSDESAATDDAKLNNMNFYSLPWPTEILRDLPADEDVALKVTLSYFIEPNPGRRGYRDRFSYQSHGLRFAVIRPGETEDNFRARINAKAVTDEYEGPEGDSSGWQFGDRLRSRGSIHCDTWRGSPQDLAAMNKIAVFPVSGWWKFRYGLGKWNNQVRYSLLVSIHTQAQDIDIYSEITTVIETQASVEVDVSGS